MTIPETEICDGCQGSGQMTCRACDGHGNMACVFSDCPDKGGNHDCPHCSDRKGFPAGWLPCASCKGTGKVVAGG